MTTLRQDRDGEWHLTLGHFEFSLFETREGIEVRNVLGGTRMGLLSEFRTMAAAKKWCAEEVDRRCARALEAARVWVAAGYPGKSYGVTGL